MTDQQANANFSANVNRLLREQNRSKYWLVQETGDAINRIYPAVNGTQRPSPGMLTRIAAALNVTVDELLDFSLETESRKTSRILEKIA